jgi:dUTP pyrophosphatase
MARIQFVKTHPNAVIPNKAHPSDSGWDLTVISLEKTMDEGNVELYNTHIKVKPPAGFYFEVVPRSSISKTGYALANSVGVIDASYRGDVFIALRKLRPDVTLELPCRIAQLVLRPLIHFESEVVEALDDTVRGSGGFGSSNQRVPN